MFFAALMVLVDAPVTAEETGVRPKKHYYTSYLGKRPPELKGLAAHWVNKAAPVTLNKLHGQVVWLEFNF